MLCYFSPFWRLETSLKMTSQVIVRHDFGSVTHQQEQCNNFGTSLITIMQKLLTIEIIDCIILSDCLQIYDQSFNKFCFF